MKAQQIMNSQVRLLLFISYKFVILSLCLNFSISAIDDTPEEHVANIHQDDDGFESLNGNVSSDNDKAIGRALMQGNRLARLGVAQQTKDRTSAWSEDSPSQQAPPNPPKCSGLIYKYTLAK